MNGSPTFCNDIPYPNQDFRLVIIGEDWSDYDGQSIVVAGTLSRYRGLLQIIAVHFTLAGRSTSNHYIDAIGRSHMELIRVYSSSRTTAVVEATAGVIREHKYAEVQAVGANAVNQAMKALVLAIGYLKSEGIQIACVPYQVDVIINDQVRSAIKLVIEPIREPVSVETDS